MMSRSVPVWLALTAACAAAPAPRAAPKPPGAAAASTPAMSSIADKVAGTRAMPGLFNLYWDERAGKLWLEIGQWQQEFLYQSALPAGVGSNDIGLDRGQLGATRVVRFERIGPKVLLVQANLAYRAVGAPPDEARTVRESFAESALWGFSVAAETGGRVVVDATEFFLRDAHDIPATLKRAGQGAFHVDAARSALVLDHTRSFPRNTEVEATLTFAGDEPGAWVRQVTPTPGAITVREHHAFVALPPPGFRPRAYDPRSSLFGISYQDYATPFSEPIVQRWAARHRLEKKDPSSRRCGPGRPARPRARQTPPSAPTSPTPCSRSPSSSASRTGSTHRPPSRPTVRRSARRAPTPPTMPTTMSLEVYRIDLDQSSWAVMLNRSPAR